MLAEMNAIAVRPPPLSQCIACLIAETAGQRRTLETLAARTGFGGISLDETGPGFPADDDRRLPFFFFHSLIQDALLADALGRIRSDSRYRFSPAVLIIGECSMSDVVRYVNLGFDDIVTLPEAARTLERRFAHQIGTPVSYFETATYFGPDRRRIKREGESAANKPAGEFRHVRYLIQRTPLGVDILRREVVISSNPPRPTGPVQTTVGSLAENRKLFGVSATGDRGR
jgi:hypothetical protein